MTPPTLNDIRQCLDGGFVALIATCAPDGTPNVSAISDVRYVDDRHVALSFQFFNKTHANIRANPCAALHVADPATGTRYQLMLNYLRTETSGPLFEAMKAKLAGIASHVGMSHVFQLRGSDVYEVRDLRLVVGPAARLSRGEHLLSHLRESLRQLRASTDYNSLVEATLSALTSRFDHRFCMVLSADEAGQRLFMVGSHGYAQSGIGAEIGYGAGVIGVAARERTPIRITHMASEYLYGSVVRDQFLAASGAINPEREIPLPGLLESRSQLAMPIVHGARLLGVIYLESLQDGNFTHADEDACGAIADQFADRCMALSTDEAEYPEEGAPVTDQPALRGEPLYICHDERDHSVFVNHEYVIKGVAGAVLWRMLGDYVKHQRVEFTNRDLRRDVRLGLPDYADNLEARLVLLQRRLAERQPGLTLEKIGRGRYLLRLSRPVVLEIESAAGSPR